MYTWQRTCPLAARSTALWVGASNGGAMVWGQRRSNDGGYADEAEKSRGRGQIGQRTRTPSRDLAQALPLVRRGGSVWASPYPSQIWIGYEECRSAQTFGPDLSSPARWLFFYPGSDQVWGPWWL